MAAPTPMTEGFATQGLIDAIQAGQWSRAQAMVRRAGDRLPPEALRAAGLVHLEFRRYREAARLLNRVLERDAGVAMSRRYARNMAALAEHRPDVLARLEAAPADDRHELAEAAGGQLTIRRRDGGGPERRSRDGDPARAAEASLNAVHAASAIGRAATLYGYGDGYVLQALADRPPDLPFAARQTVYLIEPDPARVHLGLMIHDHAGPRGPIADPRFIWLIGPDWPDQMLAAMRGEPYLPPPAISVHQSADAPPIDAGLADVAARLADDLASMKQRIDAHYDAYTGAARSSAWTADPPRPPRVLLLTTRYSTVLRYSTADTAAAFEQLGWETRTVIEPADHLSITATAMRRAIDAFQPDLVFQIDHLRHEHPGMFPDALPFVCWIQDHLPNLTSREAAAKVGPNDFIMTGAAYRYVGDYGYPAARCIGIPKLAAVTDRPPARAAACAEDLVYISNQSAPAGAALAAMLDRHLGEAGSAAMRELTATVGQAMIEASDAGRCFPHFLSVRSVFGEAAARAGVAVNGDAEARLVELLFDQLANRLYRHQALGWARRCAEARGLRLSVYGQGWDAHPEFADFARGPVTPGEPLRELLGRTRIALQLEPYACFTHPRLLEGLAAGAFLLIRDHPFNHQPQQMIDWLSAHRCAGRCAAEVRAELGEADRPAFEAMLAEQEAIADLADPVAFARNWQACGVIEAGAPMPHLRAVTFDSAAALADRVTRYLDDADERRRIADDQRRHLLGRLSYPAGIGRLIAELRRRLGAGAAGREGGRAA